MFDLLFIMSFVGLISVAMYINKIELADERLYLEE